MQISTVKAKTKIEDMLSKYSKEYLYDYFDKPQRYKEASSKKTQEVQRETKNKNLIEVQNMMPSKTFLDSKYCDPKKPPKLAMSKQFEELSNSTTNRSVLKIHKPGKSALLNERQRRSGEDRFSELKPIKTHFNDSKHSKHPSSSIRVQDNAAMSQKKGGQLCDSHGGVTDEFGQAPDMNSANDQQKINVNTADLKYHKDDDQASPYPSMPSPAPVLRKMYDHQSFNIKELQNELIDEADSKSELPKRGPQTKQESKRKVVDTTYGTQRQRTQSKQRQEPSAPADGNSSNNAPISKILVLKKASMMGSEEQESRRDGKATETDANGARFKVVEQDGLSATQKSPDKSPVTSQLRSSQAQLQMKELTLNVQNPGLHSIGPHSKREKSHSPKSRRGTAVPLNEPGSPLAYKEESDCEPAAPHLSSPLPPNTSKFSPGPHVIRQSKERQLNLSDQDTKKRILLKYSRQSRQHSHEQTVKERQKQTIEPFIIHHLKRTVEEDKREPKIVYQYIREMECGDFRGPLLGMNQDLDASDEVLKQSLLNIRSSELNIKEEEGAIFTEREDMPGSIAHLAVDHPVLEEHSNDEHSKSPAVSDNQDQDQDQDGYNIIFLGESGPDQRRQQASNAATQLQPIRMEPHNTLNTQSSGGYRSNYKKNINQSNEQLQYEQMRQRKVNKSPIGPLAVSTALLKSGSVETGTNQSGSISFQIAPTSSKHLDPAAAVRKATKQMDHRDQYGQDTNGDTPRTQQLFICGGASPPSAPKLNKFQVQSLILYQKELEKQRNLILAHEQRNKRTQRLEFSVQGDNMRALQARQRAAGEAMNRGGDTGMQRGLQYNEHGHQKLSRNNIDDPSTRTLNTMRDVLVASQNFPNFQIAVGTSILKKPADSVVSNEMTEKQYIQRVNTEIDVADGEPVISRACNISSQPEGNKAFDSDVQGSHEASKFDKMPLKLNPSSRLASPSAANGGEGSLQKLSGAQSSGEQEQLMIIEEQKQDTHETNEAKCPKGIISKAVMHLNLTESLNSQSGSKLAQEEAMDGQDCNGHNMNGTNKAENEDTDKVL